MTIIYIILTAVPFITVFIIDSAYWWKSSEETSIQHSEQSLRYSRELISNQLGQMEDLSTWIYFDPELVNQIHSNNKTFNEDRRLQIYESFGRLFKIMELLRSDVFNYYYFNLQGKLVYTYNNGLWIDYKPAIDYNPLQTVWFQKTRQASGQAVFISELLPLHKMDQPMFSMARLVKLSTEPIGIVLLDFNFNILKDVIGNNASVPGGYFLVSDIQGNLIYTTGLLDRAKDKVLPEVVQNAVANNFHGSRKIKLNSRDYLLVFDSLDKYGIVLSHLMPISYLVSDKMSFMIKLSLMLFVMMLVLMLISMYLTYHRIKPLSLLARMMTRTEQEPFLKRFPETGRKDEISVLGQSFNGMMERIQDLIQRDYKNRIQIVESEKAMMEAQINPHFLYNTLDTIRFKALNHGETGIAEMLFALSTILRYTLASTNRKVPIIDEVEWLERYIFLQKLRFQERFEVYFEIDIAIYELKINRLILQPFIENTIIHGFKDTESGGILHINGYLEQSNRLCFEIVDNGCGFPEPLHEVIECGRLHQMEWGRIGIKNALSRLFLYYQERCIVRLDSIPNTRTAIQITIELEEELL